jgi:hypothetical protein
MDDRYEGKLVCGPFSSGSTRLVRELVETVEKRDCGIRLGWTVVLWSCDAMSGKERV